MVGSFELEPVSIWTLNGNLRYLQVQRTMCSSSLFSPARGAWGADLFHSGSAYDHDFRGLGGNRREQWVARMEVCPMKARLPGFQHCLYGLAAVWRGDSDLSSLGNYLPMLMSGFLPSGAKFHAHKSPFLFELVRPKGICHLAHGIYRYSPSQENPKVLAYSCLQLVEQQCCSWWEVFGPLSRLRALLEARWPRSLAGQQVCRWAGFGWHRARGMAFHFPLFS